ncbi:MAG: hypothetical protein ABMA00_10005 [Gemmatimonas sp.]
MIGLRNAWITARARNAARQGYWIAGTGLVAVAATLLVLVLLPRRLDDQLRRRIAELPLAPDSMLIVRRLDSMVQQQRALQAVTRPPGLGDSIRRDSTRMVALSESTIVVRSGLRPDSAAIDLMARVTRARKAPLPDSYRALAESPLMKDEPRVRALIDSIDLVDREREAHAALGGPGARYAVLTSRLTALGAGLVRLAEQRLARAVLTSITAPQSSTVPQTSSPVVSDSQTTDATAVSADSVAQHARDSLRHALVLRMAQEETLLLSTRRQLAQQDVQRAALERRFHIDIPPLAMLVAALALGVAFGFGVVLTRELRRPMVGDATEVERITAALVLRHTRETDGGKERRHVRRDRPPMLRVIERESDTFVVLHLALTGVGDVVGRVDVLSADPVMAAAVALGTAAAASRESRAVVVVESPSRAPVLGRLLRVGSRNHAPTASTATRQPDDGVHVIPLGRDARIDVQLAESGTGPHETRTERTRDLAERYDLRIYLPDAEQDAGDGASDVILCVRQGKTPLAWLSQATQRARRRQQRVRAVVLWSRDVSAVS